VTATGMSPSSLRIGLLLIAFAAAFGVLGPLVLPDPNRQDLVAAYLPPGSPGHPLGTDLLGRDVLAWVAGSVRTSFYVAGAVVALSAVVGVGVGLVAGYIGGLVDASLMRLVDLQLAVPPLLLFIAASVTLGRSAWALILLISVVSWVPYARVVRTQVRVERRRSSIAAARLAGVGHGRILAVHLLPSVWTLVLVLASLQFGFVLLSEAGLSFVGVGIQPPSQSLGFLMAQGRVALAEAWWIVVMPGAMLALLLIAVNLIGDGLQERFDVDVELVDR
jgi:peptide/nickel transport system permease protein